MSWEPRSLFDLSCFGVKTANLETNHRSPVFFPLSHKPCGDSLNTLKEDLATLCLNDKKFGYEFCGVDTFQLLDNKGIDQFKQFK